MILLTCLTIYLKTESIIFYIRSSIEAFEGFDDVQHELVSSFLEIVVLEACCFFESLHLVALELALVWHGGKGVKIVDACIGEGF